jgi:small ligand-binding sensory domain FIST
MRFTSGVSDSVQILSAVTESCEQVLKQLAGEPCHLACAFASPIYRAHWTEALQLLHEKLSPAVLIGCSGSGVIGGEREFEWVPALSIVAAHLPDVRLYPFAVSPEELERSSPGGFWVDKVGAAPDAQPVFILLVDPYTCEPSKLLAELNATYPKRPIIGGLASGGNEAGEHLLFFDTDILRDGAVGLAMTGNIAMDAIISQGCRPIGRPMIITKAEGSIVWELGGKPALTILQAVLAQLSPADRALAQQAIFVGLAMNEMTASFQAGDFLIRQLAGIDPPSGAIAVTEEVQVGQTLQFHLRDPGTSREDLRRL